MTKTDMPELLPCPFCGGKADMRREPCPDGGGYFAFIQCRDCRAKGADTYYSAGNDCPQTYQGRRDDWNARAVTFDADLIEQAISDVIVHDSGSIRDAAEYVCRNLSDTKTPDARAALDAKLAEAEARGRRKALEEAADACANETWPHEGDDAYSRGLDRGALEQASACAAVIRALSDAPAREEHPDDLAVDRFAVAMKAKLAKKRADGRGGWQDKGDCSQQFLSDLLRGHVGKGDPVDVANLAMMLHQRGEEIAPACEVTVQEAARVLLSAGSLPSEAVVEAHKRIDWCRNDQNTHRPEHPSQRPGSSCAEDIQDAWGAALRALAQGGQDDG